MVLLPKPAGGTRPIGLLPTLYRVWARLRRPVSAGWEEANGAEEFWGGKGKGSEDVAWQQAFSEEAAAAKQLLTGNIEMDLQKA